MRRVLAAGVFAFFGTAVPGIALEAEHEAIVVVFDGASLPDLLAEPALRSLAAKGGAALMNGRTDLRDAFTDTFFPSRTVGRFPFSYADMGTARPSDAVSVVTEDLASLAGPALVLVISAS
ncbi:MAG: hypothetical protein M3138_06960, partial [Actinomycetota bacterium]|nr:hypothetical protein [Actinomycetota bacterium]